MGRQGRTELHVTRQRFPSGCRSRDGPGRCPRRRQHGLGNNLTTDQSDPGSTFRNKSEPCPWQLSKAKLLPALPWPPLPSWIQQPEGPFLGLPRPRRTQPHGTGHPSDLTRPPHRTPAAPGHGPAARCSFSCLPECDLRGVPPRPTYNVHPTPTGITCPPSRSSFLRVLSPRDLSAARPLSPAAGLPAPSWHPEGAW